MLQLHLQLLLLGDVVGHHQPAAAAAEVEIMRRDVDADQLSGFGPVYPRTEPTYAVLGGGHGFLDERHFLRRMKVRDAHAQELVAGVTVVLDGRIVHFDEAKSFYIEHPRWVGIAVEELAEPLLALLQRILGLRPRPALGRLAQRPLYGGGESFDRPVLEYVVGGPGFERLDRPRLSKVAREEYKGHLWPSCARFLQRLQAVIRRKAKVGHDDVEAALVQSGHEIVACIDSENVPVDSGLTQRQGEEFRIGW